MLPRLKAKATKMSNDLKTVDNADGAVALADNPFTQFAYAESVGGSFIKFVRGVWCHGPADDSTEVPAGTLVVINMLGLEAGWITWEDGQPLETHLRRVAEGQPVPDRASAKGAIGGYVAPRLTLDKPKVVA